MLRRLFFCGIPSRRADAEVLRGLKIHQLNRKAEESHESAPCALIWRAKADRDIKNRLFGLGRASFAWNKVAKLGAKPEQQVQEDEMREVSNSKIRDVLAYIFDKLGRKKGRKLKLRARIALRKQGRVEGPDLIYYECMPCALISGVNVEKQMHTEESH